MGLEEIVSQLDIAERQLYETLSVVTTTRDRLLTTQRIVIQAFGNAAATTRQEVVARIQTAEQRAYDLAQAISAAAGRIEDAKSVLMNQ